VRFAPGQRVRVSDRPHVGHHRTPQYVKGKTGRVERVHGAFANPEKRAYGADGLPQVPLYLVAFAQRDLWPDYTRTDELHVDVYEHWLEGA
jgi:nitrile hydratase